MSTPLKAIIVDDEKMARILLQQLIETHLPYLTIVDTCSDLPSGVKSIHKHHPDLVFLDIEMPGNSGLELLDFFPEEPIQFSIIFTTAYHQYAIEAFKSSAIGYLLKPIEPEELVDAVERFVLQQNRKTSTSHKVNNTSDHDKKIALTTLQSTRYVALKDIYYFKAIGAYTEVKLTDGSTIIVSKGLKKFETTLQEQTFFFRCHKSYLINTQYITEHIKRDGGYLVLSNKEQIPLSSEKIQELNDKMDWLHS